MKLTGAIFLRLKSVCELKPYMTYASYIGQFFRSRKLSLYQIRIHENYYAEHEHEHTRRKHIEVERPFLKFEYVIWEKNGNCLKCFNLLRRSFGKIIHSSYVFTEDWMMSSMASKTTTTTVTYPIRNWTGEVGKIGNYIEIILPALIEKKYAELIVSPFEINSSRDFTV